MKPWERLYIAVLCFLMFAAAVFALAAIISIISKGLPA